MRRVILLVGWLQLLVAGIAASQPLEDTTVVRLIALGDVNLGRSMGQLLLKDSLEAPFRGLRGIFQPDDIVFGNLESPISDQGGETRHPKDPLVFCAPPEAATALRLAGFDILSTANNHVADYGWKGLRETMEFLSAAGLRWIGTARDSVARFVPKVIERRGVRFAFLAYTEFLNKKGNWGGHISLYDEERARVEVASARKVADVVVVSYHGGVEYAEQPGKWTRAQMRQLVDFGADLVIGHHPHVPQGIECYHNGLILYSLGNAVFIQPQKYWTRRGVMALAEFRRVGGTAQLTALSLVPLDVSRFPTTELDARERLRLLKRLQQQSNRPMVLNNGIVAVHLDASRQPR